jgi:dihydropyrimidinase
MGLEAFTQIPNGIPSIQERVDLVHTYGVAAGKIDLRTLVNACSTHPAQQFAMFPQKGALAVGSDGDLVIYDPAFFSTFKHAQSLSKVDYCGFEGMQRKGRAELVFLRGCLAAREGAFVGKQAAGQYISR